MSRRFCRCFLSLPLGLVSASDFQEMMTLKMMELSSHHQDCILAAHQERAEFESVCYARRSPQLSFWDCHSAR